MKRKIKFKSVKTLLTFWFIVTALAPLVVVSTIVYYQRVESIKTEAFNKLTAVRDLKVHQVNDWINERIGDARTMGEDPHISALENIFKKHERSQDDIQIIQEARAHLTRYIKNYKAYSEIFIINPVTGQIEISSNKSSVGQDKSKDHYFIEPIRTKKICIRDIYYSKTMNKPSMAFSVPIYSLVHKDHITGILVARIDMEPSLYDLLLDRTGMGKTGETLIVNKDVIALNELRWYERAPLKLKILAKPARQASLGKTGIIETTDYRNEEVLAAYSHIQRTGWGFVAKQDLKEIYAPIGSMLRQILLLFVIAIAGVYVIALLLGKTIARPVLEMTETSKRIEGGDRSIRNQIESDDEFGYLAKSFNDMADAMMSRLSIQKSIAEITETMVAAGEMTDFAGEVLKKIMGITGSNLGSFYLLNKQDNKFNHLTSMGVNPDLLEPFDASIFEGEMGKAISSKKITHIKKIREDTVFKFRTFIGTALPKEIITVPIIVRNEVLAVISLASLNEYSREELEILNQARLIMNTAFSNLLATEEIRDLARDLDSKNQELEAQTEELQSLNEELNQQSEELQEQNVELEVQRKQVEEANRLKSEFLSNMSHELRTPLNSVMALSRVLIMQAKQKLSEEEGRYLDIIERNGKQLLALINDILDLSKIEAGRMDVSQKLFSLGSTISSIVDSLVPVAEEKGVKIIEDVPGHLPQIESNEARIHQILQNIIGNAVKFTNQGDVTVSAHSDAQKVFINIADTGIGISEKDLPHIFEEFRQIDGSSSRQYEGTGLGLAIAYKAAKILGGEISVESDPGKGSLFTLTLPIRWMGTVPIHEPMAVKPRPEIEPGRKTILIVDDEPDVLDMLSECLSEEGYIMVRASSGEEALRLAEIHRPFAITLDVIMSEMDGWEVLQRLKTNPDTKDIPVIIVSVAEEKETGFVLGAFGYINKSFTRDALMEEIKKLLFEIESRPRYRRLDAPQGAKRILLVEDNEAAVIQVKSALENEGYILEVTQSGQEALDYVKQTIPDGIILDLMMPGVDGFEVLEEIRNTGETAKVPVLVLTAKDLTTEDFKRLTTNNIQQLIQKGDVDREGLLLKTKMMLGAEARVNAQPETPVPEFPVFKPEPSKTRKIKGIPTILVAEDNPDNLTTIKAVLQNRYNILEATDGEEGLKKALTEKPDLILLDISLPKMDGYTVVRKIRGDREARHIPVIGLTAHAMRGDREKIIEAGCDDYISKPIDPVEILKKIDKWIKGEANAENLSHR